MEKLKEFLKSLTKEEKKVFERSINTSINYLRKAASTNSKINIELCLKIEKESNRIVTCEDLRPDVDWLYFETRKG